MQQSCGLACSSRFTSDTHNQALYSPHRVPVYPLYTVRTCSALLPFEIVFRRWGRNIFAINCKNLSSLSWLYNTKTLRIHLLTRNILLASSSRPGFPRPGLSQISFLLLYIYSDMKCTYLLQTLFLIYQVDRCLWTVGSFDIRLFLF